MKMSLDMFKFILAGVGVTKVKLHPDEKRMAVLTPMNQTVQIWDIQGVVRLQSYSVPTDACYLFWERVINKGGA